MQELLVRGKNTINPEVIDPGGQSVEDSPVKSEPTLHALLQAVTNYEPSSLSPLHALSRSIKNPE
jgi:hypothetical protein